MRVWVFRSRVYEAVVNKRENCDTVTNICKNKSQSYHKKHNSIIFITDGRDWL